MRLHELKIEHIPFFRIFLSYTSGIIISYQITWNDQNYRILILLFSTILILTLAIWFFQRIKRVEFLLLILIFLLGNLNLASYLPRQVPDLQNSKIYSAILLNEPERKGQVLKSKIELILEEGSPKISYGNHSLMATIWDKDSALVGLEKGDIIKFYSKIQQLPTAYNPGQFDYARYLKSNGIFYQVFIPANRFKIVKKREPTSSRFEQVISNIQRFLQSKFKEFVMDESAYQIASAITFGYRADLSDEVMEVFSNTGTIHVLSVSGFHVSLMFGLLTFLLKPIDRIPNGRHIRFLFILFFIWFYAVICGFVPAVLRATLMFSLFLIGHWKNRVVFSLNAVFSSAFLLLVYDPFMLFDIGFQLSYLAVLGILIFTPIFKNIYESKNKIFNHLLNLIYVSLAAQITTTSLAMYYFHQFPTYFLFSNLIITIPSTLILYLGSILVIPWQNMNEFIGVVLNKIVLYSYYVLRYIDSLPFSSIQGIPFSLGLTILSYLVILLFFFSYRLRNKVMLFSAFLLLIIIFGIVLKTRIEYKSFEGLKIYNTRKDLTFAIFNSSSVHVFSTCDSINHKTLKFAMLPDVKRYTELDRVNFIELKDSLENQSIDLQQGLKVFIMNNKSSEHQRSKILIIRNNSPLPQELNASLTILDGSNSWSHINQLILILNAENRAYYILKDNFAYVWESNKKWKKQAYPY